MRNILLWIRIKPVLMRKAVMALVMVGATVAAFYWGRMGAKADAQQVQPRVGVAVQPAGQQSDYSRRVVAWIYENMPISREDLGEYLIARYGPERVEFLINRRIVELECQAKGVYVRDEEVESQFKEDLKGYGNLTAKDFNDQILKRFNKSLYEWKEDVIRPKLALAKLCRPLVQVTHEDLVKAYEARYGPKVQCRMIAFAKSDRHMGEVWNKIKDNEVEFANYAKIQFIQQLQAKGGEISPIHKHFGDPKIEAAAFNLQPGQVTSLMEMPDGTYIVLKCDKHLPKDMTRTFESVAAELAKEMDEIKLARKIPEHFADLRKKANPRVLITNQVREEDLVRDVGRSLNNSANGPGPRPTGPAGN